MMISGETITIYTIGTSTKTAETFFTKIRGAGVKQVIDVRLRNRGSYLGFSRYPDLPYFLMEIGRIAYSHVPNLAPTKELLDAYKPKKGKNGISWPTYERRFNKIITERRIENMVTQRELQDACLLCSEPEPDKCHRRLVAEYLQRKWGNVQIGHIL